MGLTNNTENKTYLNLVGGKFAKKVTKETEGAISRTNKKGDTVYELLFDKLEGVRIKNITKKVDDYGAKWEVVLTEVLDEYVLNLSYSGRTSNGLLHRLPNIDFSNDMTLSLFTNNEGKTYLAVIQNGEKVPTAYTKENPNGLPQLEKVMRKGKEEWDDTKQGLFIEAMIEGTIKPQLTAQTMQPVVAQAEQVEEPGADMTDDLPFLWLLIPFLFSMATIA